MHLFLEGFSTFQKVQHVLANHVAKKQRSVGQTKRHTRQRRSTWWRYVVDDVYVVALRGVRGGVTWCTWRYGMLISMVFDKWWVFRRKCRYWHTGGTAGGGGGGGTPPMGGLTGGGTPHTVAHSGESHGYRGGVPPPWGGWGGYPPLRGVKKWRFF